MDDCHFGYITTKCPKIKTAQNWKKIIIIIIIIEWVVGTLSN
jgi:hypothetical protein